MALLGIIHTVNTKVGSDVVRAYTSRPLTVTDKRLI